MPATSSCQPCCTTPINVQIPGVAGVDGVDGTNGINAFTTFNGADTVPANPGDAKTYALVDSSWMVVGQFVIAQVSPTTVANFKVTALPSTISATLEWQGYPGDVAGGTAIASGGNLSPAGQRGGGTLFYTPTAVDLPTVTPFMDVIDITASGKTVTLPTAVGITGKVYTVKLSAAAVSTGTVDTTGGQTIDGAASYSLSASKKFVTVISNGANWLIIGNN